MCFRRKRKDLEVTKEGSQGNFMQNILTCKLRNEILRTQGEEFDLYLRGLRFRNFANEMKNTNIQHYGQINNKMFQEES